MTARPFVPASAPPWFTGSPQRWRRLSLDWASIAQGMAWVARLRLAASASALAALLFALACAAFWGDAHEIASVCGGLAAFGLCLSFALPLACASFARELGVRRAANLRLCSTLIAQGAISEALLPQRPPRRTLEAHVAEALARSRFTPVVTQASATDQSGRSIDLDILPPR